MMGDDDLQTHRATARGPTRLVSRDENSDLQSSDTLLM